MNRTLLLIAIIVLMPATLAITITAPTENITATSLPVEITAEWDANHTEYQVLLTRNGQPHTNTTTTQENIQLTLQAGEYELTVTSNTTQDTTSFTVSQEQAVELTISTNKNTYEVQETVQLAVTTTQAVTATLDILRGTQVVDTYTIPIESSVNLIYIPDEPGSYTARLQANGQTATATFEVIQTPPLTIDFIHQTPYINRATQFNATATGGVAPYTYQWIFSDETTSNGRNVLHYFFEEGPHTATLVVTDNEGTRESITKNFDVTTPTHTLEVVVRKSSGELVQGAHIRLVKTNYDETKTTPQSGLITFSNLRGNYTLTLTHEEEIRVEETIEMTRDRTKVYALQVQETEETQEEEPETVEEETQETQQETPQTTTNQSETIPQQATTQNTLQEKRAQAKEELTQRKFNLQLSASKDEILKTLGLYEEFDQAIRRIDTASEAQLATILAQAPKDVRIRDEQTRITYPDPQDVEKYTEQFLEVRGVQDDKLARQYRHSIKETSQDVIIRTTTKAVTIEYPNTNKDYVIIRKEVTAPEDSYAVEFIPPTLAQDVSRLSIQGEYDVLRANPVLRFRSKEYAYWAETRTAPAGYTLIVPQQLQSPPGLIGLVTIRLGDANPMRGIIYIFLLGIFLVGIVAGGKISKSRQQTHLFEDFTELAHQALDAINQGQGAQAAHITNEIIAIYQELPPEQQTTVQDIIEHLQTNQQEQHFFGALSKAYETIQAQQDINHVSAAYEKTLTTYETLPEESKQQLKEHITQLHTYLDNYTQ